MSVRATRKPPCDCARSRGRERRGRPTRGSTAAWIAIALAASSSRAHAVDTVEPFGAGDADVELYLGADGIGPGDAAAGSWLQLGYGLSERLSTYLGLGASTTASGQPGERSLRVGLFGTALDTDRLDLDLLAEVRLAGARGTASGVASGLELTLDLGRLGLFATAWEAIGYGEPSGAGGRPAGARALAAELAVGAYWNLAPGRQLLARYDSLLHHADGARHEIGGLALGYNAMIGGRVEIVTEVTCDLPRAGEALAFGLSTGFILALP